MRSRCSCKTNKKYKRYGGRGISICKRWAKFKNFYLDMGERPVGTTLDRINNDRNYSPSNCRWATQQTQQTNRSNNRYEHYNGRLRRLSEISKMCGVKEKIIRQRIDRDGMSIKLATRGGRYWGSRYAHKFTPETLQKASP